ncbi:VIT1/CCC1 transporter family protein [Bartonella sp. B10]
MLKSFFSFVQRKALSFRATQQMMIRSLKSKEQHAALYLKYAQALEPYSSKQAAIFTAMGLQELQNYRQLLCLSCKNHAAVCDHRIESIDSLCAQLSLIKDKHHPKHHPSNSQTKEKTSRHTQDASKTHKQMLLTWIQPGLAGLMDGSVSTLAPIFAAAFATGDTYQTFLIGLSASIGAGLSMGFTEAAHDDGKLSGRGSPLKRGIASGIMTTLGGLGHTLPYLINSFYIATITAFIIVFFELLAIVWIQNKFMSTPFWRASLQVIIGGALVFATGIFIGSI